MVNLSPLQEFRSTSPFSQTWKRSAEKLWIIRASLVLRKELQKIGVGDIGSRSHQPTASPCTHLQLCYLAFASCPNFLLEKQREVYSLSVLVVSAFLNWNKQKKSNSIKRKKINSIAIATEPPPPTHPSTQRVPFGPAIHRSYGGFFLLPGLWELRAGREPSGCPGVQPPLPAAWPLSPTGKCICRGRTRCPGLGKKNLDLLPPAHQGIAELLLVLGALE